MQVGGRRRLPPARCGSQGNGRPVPIPLWGGERTCGPFRRRSRERAPVVLPALSRDRPLPRSSPPEATPSQGRPGRRRPALFRGCPAATILSLCIWALYPGQPGRSPAPRRAARRSPALRARAPRRRDRAVPAPFGGRAPVFLTVRGADERADAARCRPSRRSLEAWEGPTASPRISAGPPDSPAAVPEPRPARGRSPRRVDLRARAGERSAAPGPPFFFFPERRQTPLRKGRGRASHVRSPQTCGRAAPVTARGFRWFPAFTGVRRRPRGLRSGRP